jgi:hypothetical protein
MNAVVGGWELSSAIVLQSGQFFSLTYSGTSWLQNRNGGASRPDCTGANPYTGNSTWAWNNNALYRNTAAFSVPAAGLYGNCPANSTRLVHLAIISYC